MMASADLSFPASLDTRWRTFLALPLFRSFVLALSISVPSFPAISAALQSSAVPAFRIGTFNRSSGEFRGGIPSQNVLFEAGKSDPVKDWYAHHPADSPAHPPGSAPRAIRFSLDGTRAPAYRLHVAVLLEDHAVPALRIGINGRAGLFYLHPALVLSNGDASDSFDPVYSAADVEFDFPGAWLAAGENTISLQPVEQTATVIPGAGLNYDAIELDPLSHGAPRLASARIEPTVYFQNDGRVLKEEVDVFVRYPQAAGAGSAELTIGGQRYRAATHGPGAFGEENLDFLVSEFAPAARARLIMHAGVQTLEFAQTISPAKKWTLYVIPHIHTDIGYSDYQAKVAAVQSHALDEALDLIAQHPEFRYSLDGEWDLEQFLGARSRAEQQRVIKAIREKKIFVPAQYACLLTGLPTAETSIRSLYPSADFSRLHGTPLDYANITDVPSYTWSYASILAAAGIPYLAAGSNNYRAPVLLIGRLQEHSPMWWECPDRKHVLLWYSRHYEQLDMIFGAPPVMAAGRQMLPLFLQMYETPQYKADAAIIYGTQVENHALYPEQAVLAAEWNSKYAYPHLRYSGFREAMEEIARQFGGRIPTVRGDGGPYWEDGVASDAFYVALERHNEARAPSAEKLATLASLTDPRLAVNSAALDGMWKKMILMDEHTWGAADSVSDPESFEAVDQLAIKDSYALDAAAGIEFMARRSMAQLADRIPAGPNSLVVFNTLSWKRDGTVSLDLKKGEEVADSEGGAALPVEILESRKYEDRARFMARNVPAFGYRVYTIREATRVAQTKAPEPTIPTATSLQNAYYGIELDARTGDVR
jgi:hypothetical protein